jgi:hypothetical protein
MIQLVVARTGLVRVLAAAAVVAGAAGCAAGGAGDPAPPQVPASVAVSPPPAAPSGDDGGAVHGGGGGHGGHGGGATTAPALPADFPADVPLPPGSLEASNGSAGHWNVLLVVGGSASEAQRSAMTFYTAAGFTADDQATAHRGPYAITIGAENRDHSNTSTHLVVGVART